MDRFSRTSLLLAATSLALVAATLTAPAQAEDWTPTQIKPTSSPLHWSRATLNDQVTLDELGRRPVVDREKNVFLLACERDVQLDCIESVGLVSADGTYVQGTFRGANTFDTNRDPVNPFAQHDTYWNMPGLVINGVSSGIGITAGLAGLPPQGFHGLNIGLWIIGPSSTPVPVGNKYGCEHDDRADCRKEPEFPPGTVLRIVMRTSWLAPHAAFVRGTNVDFGLEDLGGGAHRITVTGEPMLLQSQDSAELETGVPDWVHSTFDFGIYDKRLGHGVGGDCTVNNPLLISGNGSDGGVPTWNANTGELNLQMRAPHYWSDGTTEWLGIYQTDIPMQAAKCMWGVDPETSSNFGVNVYDENGNVKPATTSIALEDGLIKIRASGFTFSTNRVAAQVTPKAGDVCYSEGMRIADFECRAKSSGTSSNSSSGSAAGNGATSNAKCVGKKGAAKVKCECKSKKGKAKKKCLCKSKKGKAKKKCLAKANKSNVRAGKTLVWVKFE